MRKLGLYSVIALFSATFAHAQAGSAPLARLTIRSGIVESQHEQGPWHPIFPRELLDMGDRIRTAKGSIAAIDMGLRTVITLNEDSQVRVGPAIELESGTMKVFSSSDIRVSAKDTVLEFVEGPVDLELGFQADKLSLMVFAGGVKAGPITIRGSNLDPSVRTYVANGRSQNRQRNVQVNPAFYIYPYFLYGNANPNAGRIIPPTVNNPTNPGYRPTQVVPPMSDPIRVPVTPQ